MKLNPGDTILGYGGYLYRARGVHPKYRPPVFSITQG